MVNRQRDTLRIHVTLEGILPPVWREIVVPASYTFWDLHVAIQDAMGWLDCHLHEFGFAEGEPGDDLRIGIPDEDSWGEVPEVLASWDVPVLEWLREPGQRLAYLYDFGDDWQHTVTLLAIEPREKGQRYPQCIAGQRACPPEDCGGVDGYHELLDTLFDPADPDFEEMRAWIPDAVRFDNPRRRWEQAFLADD
jgi:hypothetical protein